MFHPIRGLGVWSKPSSLGDLLGLLAKLLTFAVLLQFGLLATLWADFIFVFLPGNRVDLRLKENLSHDLKISVDKLPAPD